jgi:methionyl-tRNA formyltransferase
MDGASAPRIVCVGANLESETVLNGLLDRGARIAGLVTLPRVGAEHVCDYRDLHDLCSAHDVAVVDAVDINSPGVLDAIDALRPDFIYTLGWSQLFGDRLLRLPTRYIVGSHPSLLPQGRGRAPVPWTVLQDLRTSAVTLFRMRPGADTGPILIQKHFDVPPRAYADEVYALVAENLRDAFCELYEAHCAGTAIIERPQDASQATHRGKRTPADGHIDFQRPAADIERLIRATSHPYPGAYSYYAGKAVRVWRASLANVPNHVGTVGQILLKNAERLLVQAADQPLWLSDFSVDDGPVSYRHFRIGAKFGYAVEDELHRLHGEVAELRQQLADAFEFIQRRSVA